MFAEKRSSFFKKTVLLLLVISLVANLCSRAKLVITTIQVTDYVLYCIVKGEWCTFDSFFWRHPLMFLELGVPYNYISTAGPNFVDQYDKNSKRGVIYPLP